MVTFLPSTTSHLQRNKERGGKLTESVSHVGHEPQGRIRHDAVPLALPMQRQAKLVKWNKLPLAPPLPSFY